MHGGDTTPFKRRHMCVTLIRLAWRQCADIPTPDECTSHWSADWSRTEPLHNTTRGPRVPSLHRRPTLPSSGSKACNSLSARTSPLLAGATGRSAQAQTDVDPGAGEILSASGARRQSRQGRTSFIWADDIPNPVRHSTTGCMSPSTLRSRACTHHRATKPLRALGATKRLEQSAKRAVEPGLLLA